MTFNCFDVPDSKIGRKVAKIFLILSLINKNVYLRGICIGVGLEMHAHSLCF